MWTEKLALEFLLDSACRARAQVCACTRVSMSVPILAVCTCVHSLGVGGEWTVQCAPL